MRRYSLVGIAAVAAVAFVMTGKINAPVAHAAGAYGKGAGLAKQPFKENRKKAAQKAGKGTVARPIGP